MKNKTINFLKKQKSQTQLQIGSFLYFYREINTQIKEVILIQQLGGSSSNEKINVDKLNFIFNIVNQFQDHLIIFIYESQYWESQEGFFMLEGQFVKKQINQVMENFQKSHLIKFYVNNVDEIEKKLKLAIKFSDYLEFVCGKQYELENLYEDVIEWIKKNLK